jgi:hypothetical protein
VSTAGDQGHLLMSAGRGPQECAWAVAQLLRGGRAVTKASWRIHDELVRGNPTRIERPDTQPGSDPPTHG